VNVEICPHVHCLTVSLLNIYSYITNYIYNYITDHLVLGVPDANNGISASRVQSIQSGIKLETVDARSVLPFRFIANHV